jgi:hypothetical protein
MWNEIALEEQDENTNKNPIFALTKELNENMNKSTKLTRPGGSSNFGKISKHHEYY